MEYLQICYKQYVDVWFIFHVLIVIGVFFVYKIS